MGVKRNIIIETDRLILSEFHLDDVQDLYLLNTDEAVLRYTGDRPFKNIEDAANFVRNYDHYNLYNHGRWSVHLKRDHTFLGWCGLKFNEVKLVDIGYRFNQKDWGKGYATESAKACIEYGFDQLGLKEIIGRVDPRNLASIKVLKKLGMSYWKDGDCRGQMQAHYYRLSKEECRV